MGFTGWPPEALDWFEQLEADNTKAWFHAHRSTYDDAVRGPLELLLEELAPEFGEAIVSRPNRDTRFSKDKTPYKLQIYGRIPVPSGGTYYVQLRREGLFVGAGLYAADREQLARVRAAIADDRTGGQLEAIIADVRTTGADLLVDGALKTAPRGYATDHPRIDLLRLPHLAAGKLHPPRKWLHTPAAEQRVVDGWRSLGPLLDWLASIS